MQSLKLNIYQQCFNDSNIEYAIKYTLANINYDFKNNQFNFKDVNINETIKKVKLILRRRKKCYCKIINDIYLFDYECKKKEYYIYNIEALAAQRIVYNLLKQVIPTANKKDTVVKAANILQTSKYNFIISFNLKSILQDVNINDYLKSLKTLVNDFNLLKTIKHLVWYSDQYNGNGLNDNLLKPILISAYLKNFDTFVEDNISGNSNSFQRNFEKHKEHYIEWLQKNNKKVYAQYYRYDDEVILICHSRSEQIYMYHLIDEYIKEHSNIKIDIKLSYNRVRWLGFLILKRKLEKSYLEIKIDNIASILKFLKTFKFNSLKDVWDFKRWFMYLCSYYDIVNDFSKLLNHIINRLYFRSRRDNTHILKEKNKSEYYLTMNGKKFILDIFDIRKATKLSYKEYMFHKKWILSKDYITSWKDDKFTSWSIYKYALFVKQQGKDIVTNQYLNFDDMNIHHLVHRKNGGEDRLNNLILISSQTHKDIHKYGKKINRLITLKQR